MNDLRYALRRLAKSPGFTTVAVLTLALGIGANTAIFSVVRKVLLDRLPYREPDRLVRLYGGAASNPNPRGMLTPAEIADLQQSRVFAEVAPFSFYGGVTYVGDGRAEVWESVQVGPEFFHLLGVRPLLGRGLDARDTGPDAVPVVVLSYTLWQRTFGGDAGIVGRDVQLNGHARTVVGVMPAEFVAPERSPEIWMPLYLRPLLRNPVAARHGRMLRAVGRLADGITPVRLRTELDVLTSRAREQYTELSDLAPVHAVPLRDAMVGEVRPALLTVTAAAGLVLLITCVNLAGLLLSRATARRRELAVRAALGAERGRLVRWLLAESGIIGFAGGAVGVTLAFWGKDILVDLAGRFLPHMGEVTVDAPVLAFAVAVALLSTLGFGLLPALAGTRMDLHDSLAESGRGASGGRVAGRLGRLLVIGQMAVAVVLLIGAGLLGRTLIGLERTGVGFDRGSDVLTFGVNLASANYADRARQAAFFDAFTERIRALPGVRAAGAVAVAPWNGYTAFGADSISVETGAAVLDRADMASRVTVSEDYFAALGIPLRGGRAFTASDRDGAPLVAIVNESVARQYWPDASPVDRRIRIGGRGAPWRRVVGVVGDVRPDPSHDIEPTVYVPMRQEPRSGASFVVRAAGNATALVPTIRRALQEVDPALPLVGTQTMEGVFKSMLAGQRLPTLFSTSFASLALLLATLGVYSVTAYSVAARTREFGIRTALGARATGVLALVLRQGLTLAVTGTAAGLIVAWATTHLLVGLLVGVTAHDPVTFVAVPAILLGVTGAACLVPARRAAQVDPMVALRYE